MTQNSTLKLLFLSTPVGVLGSGIGGGVELTLYNLAREMMRCGHQVRVVAPKGSQMEGIPIVEIPGNLQQAAQIQSRDTPVEMPEASVLAGMWDYARRVQGDWDLIVNFAFDWLPFYLTPFFQCKIAHFISMGSMTTALDRAMEKIALEFPATIGVYTHSQAETFPFTSTCRILGSGIDLSLYKFCAKPENALAWLGRIAPEKALEDAVEAAQMTGIPLKIFGKIQDEKYWKDICKNHPNAPIEYGGFLSTRELQSEVRQCRAVLMTPRWVEAFGNVAIEALACGVPVISYRRGGPAEIVRDAQTGFLVEPDSVAGLVDAIARIDEIDRSACRQQAEREYSLTALGNRFEAWFQDILKA
ncbi:glycosyltransferase family 4 protein [Lusitaniella coriacea LEGE 07157]|uniref:Glycosyltransferase family 4 protein n=1 Tax=Lusitaniella coriacea LEGE 07157 TaxID=945747 RepID=A0A8J7E095_9CYAN|nr:glycosyltransferase family 4 protein [Lusitaniella coriacea]MBE9118912.1 glycosyltransferase family 4 protein [Lusitaniella coriacea LEGE 07157]